MGYSFSSLFFFFHPTHEWKKRRVVSGEGVKRGGRTYLGQWLPDPLAQAELVSLLLTDENYRADRSESGRKLESLTCRRLVKVEYTILADGYYRPGWNL